MRCLAVSHSAVVVSAVPVSAVPVSAVPVSAVPVSAVYTTISSRWYSTGVTTSPSSPTNAFTSERIPISPGT